MRLRNIPRAGGVLEESPFVIKSETSYKGKWAQEIFQNSNPIHIEIGMGKGQFLLTLARQNPDVNYIGIERYSSVLLRAVEKLTPDRKAQTSGIMSLSNLRFICMDAAGLDTVFAPQEISRIYLNFSDPWPKKRHAHRRLTSPEYFERYDHILKSGGQIEFKTDNKDLFNFSADTLEASDIWKTIAITRDLHRDTAMNTGNIMTEYEEKFSSMNHPIYKLIAKRQSDWPFCI
ncbi:tRNA (guanosine(46)-N7)-methyltransferase TrmB [Lachnospiraceae bacterium 42-17]|jgi:tRNA (guanine-N7-)-methyltransferase|nr:tRNA (guanosine(46)-N7)-methyltransferase TrmB [Dorea sp.]